MPIHRFHSSLLFLLLSLLLLSCGAERYVRRGEKAVSLGEWYDAGVAFRRAYQLTPARQRDQRGELAARMAQCYERSLQTARAVAALRSVIRYNKATLQTHRTLGRLLMQQGQYREAVAELRLVLDSLPRDPLAAAALQGALHEDSVRRATVSSSRYTVRRVEALSSRRADYSPMLLPDDPTRIYFSSTRDEALGDEVSGVTGTKQADIFYAERDQQGRWSKPEPVSGGLCTAMEEATPAFSPDGKEMLITQCLTDPTYPRYAQICASQRADAAWGKPAPLKLTADTLSSFAHPAYSPDGQWLYFVSDMPGGLGGLDIWRVRVTAAGFGGVENVGAPINTAGNEMFPTFRPNGDLYFSSDGHPGLGGLDIFIAHPVGAGKFRLSHPDAPLNSRGDDFGMTFEGKANRGFFSSNRGDARGYDHIYSFDCPEIQHIVRGWVYEMGGYELPAAQVRVVADDGTNKRLSVRTDGSFSLEVQPGTRYLLMASCPGFLNHQEQITLPTSLKQSSDTTLQFALANITAPVLIDNIFYDFDRATLRDTSRVALDKLVELLRQNPHVVIELSAHCDYKGSADYNLKLSQRRAEAVTAYLRTHGIAAERLRAVGRGKEQPHRVTKRQAALLPWLHEGQELSEAFVTSLTDARQRDVCDQLNRRTEFRVVSTTYGLFDEHGRLVESPKPKPQSTVDEDVIVFD